MAKRNNPSPEVVAEAMQVAKATQKPGQTKEQTKLIAQGIQKGIEEYKKRNKEKARELDKQKRKLQQAKSTLEQEQTNPTISNETLPTQPTTAKQSVLPWLLLAISWLGFAGYFFLLHP
ncbi:DUF2956 domain-containing protein [Motilimonas cestriensis]|uniref:DUF2956 domain-containing protein n=1 Tax=Motilimonas cestriensis TaxID=2742685 RepID=UPI003DA2C43E